MTDEETRQRRSRRWAWVARSRLLVLVITVGLLIVPVGVVTVLRNAPPTKRSLLEKAGLMGKRELLIGVIDDMPRISERDSSGRFSGFDIDMGYLVASYLGFNADETKFVAMASENRASMRANLARGRWVTVDLVVASYSITEERERRDDVTFSAPYLTTWQSVLTRRGHTPVEDLGDLKDKLVCTIGTSTSETPPEKAGVKLRRKPKIGQCVNGLLNGDYEAVTTDAAILAGFVDRYPDRLMHHDIALDTVENWGINSGRNPALHTLVNRALWLSRHDPKNRDWENAFDKWLRPIEEVNAPQDIANDEQPEVPKVEVREDSWGDLGLVPTTWRSRDGRER